MLQFSPSSMTLYAAVDAFTGTIHMKQCHNLKMKIYIYIFFSLQTQNEIFSRMSKLLSFIQQKIYCYSHSQVYGSKVYDDQIYVIIVNTYL